ALPTALHPRAACEPVARLRSLTIVDGDDAAQIPPIERCLDQGILGVAGRRANLRRRPAVALAERSVRSRSSAGERPPHTRKVTGSIPVGTTTKHLTPIRGKLPGVSSAGDARGSIPSPPLRPAPRRSPRVAPGHRGWPPGRGAPPG